MLILLLASLLSAPVPDKIIWVRPDDYPLKYVEAGRQFTIGLRATIRPDGTAQECSIEQSGGDVAFDKYNCELLLRRVRFTPATDASGKPTIGIFRQRIAWILDYRKPKPNLGDIEVTIAKQPDGLKSPTWIDVALAVDNSGKPSGCASGKPDQHPSLVRTACAQLINSYRAMPARLTTGEAVASVQSAKVSFVTR